MEEESLKSEIALWPIERRQAKFKPVDSSAVKLSAKIIKNGFKVGTKFLLTIDDQHLFTATDWCQFGRTYRCRDRQNCKARVVLTPNGEVYLIKGAQNHNHSSNSDQMVKDSAALHEIKIKCTDVKEIASGRRLTKVSDIVNEVLVR